MARRGTLLGVILLLFGAWSIHGDDSDSPCKRMQASGGIGSKGILCVSQLTNDRLIVITRDWYVYQLPMSSLESSVSKLYVNDSKPEPIAKKWPKIASNANFTRTLPILHEVFFYVTGNQNLLFMETKPDAIHNGATFDVDTQKWYDGLRARNATGDRLYIGSYKRNKFYGIEKANGTLQLLLYKRNCTSADDVVCDIDPVESSIAYYICTEKGASKLTLQSSLDGCNKVDWPVLNGFISKDKFYLFGDDYVITFPESVYGSSKKSVPFDKVPYGSFIQCGGGDGVGRDAIGGAKDTPLKIGWIVAIVLLCAFLLLGCALFLMRAAKARKKKKKKGSHHGTKNSPRASKQSIATIVSARSAGGPKAAGALSARQASKRSSYVSKAGKLSKRGPSGMTTQRSGSASKFSGAAATFGGTKRSPMKHGK